MAVCYTLREPNPPRAEYVQDIIGNAGVPNQSVNLTAPEGIEAEQVVEQISNIASLQVPFEDARIGRFCERYQVTEENDKRLLRNLLTVLKRSRLVLENRGTNTRLDVNPPASMSSMDGKKWIWLGRI